MTAQSTPTDVVIGAGSGMGAAIAAALANNGRRLVLADRDRDAADRLASTLAGETETARCDITDQDAVDALIATVGSAGRLVVTAGLSPSMAAGQRIYEVNLIGADRVIRAFESIIGPASVGVAFASMAGHMIPADPAVDALIDDPSAPGFLERLDALGVLHDAAIAYSISKRGVLRLVERRAATWGRRGGRLVSVSPGIIDTPMGRLESANRPIKADIVDRSALGREGSAAEIAAAVAFLTSDAASFITGTDLLVDGGATAAHRH